MHEILTVLPSRDLGVLARQFAVTAIEAGAAIIGCYERGCPSWSKADRSPVTEADQTAESIILAKLHTLVPDVPVIAEEACAACAPPIVRREFVLVDALDGTLEFLNRNGEFTVNIALIRDGEPVCGVVFAPVLRRIWIAAEQASAAMIGPDWSLPSSPGEPLRTRPRPCDGLIALTSRSHCDAQTEAFLARLPVVARQQGGSSVKFCLLAEGKADVYPRFSPTMEWDTAAGHAVLKAAGGSVVELDGGPLRYGKQSRGFRNPAFIAWGALQSS